MDFSSLSLTQLMQAKMDFISARHSVLAANVANVDTPGFKAKDVKQPDFKKMLHSTATGSGSMLKMVSTNAQHMQTGMAGGIEYKTITRDITSELNPSGNNVSPEEEMAKVAGNQSEYTTVMNLYSKTISMFKNALGNSNG